MKRKTKRVLLFILMGALLITLVSPLVLPKNQTLVSAGTYGNTTGIVDVNGKLIYVENGEQNTSYTGLVKYSGKHYAVIKGAVDFSYTGIIQNKNNKNWHYVEKGVYKNTFTGIAKRIDDKQDYLVIKGYLDPKKNGLIKVGSKYYAINKGKVNYGFTGIVKNEVNGNWHYVKSGIYEPSFTGIAKRMDNNQDYLVVKGYLDFKRDGLIKVGSKYYAIDKGRVNYGYTGIIQNKANGNWHYVKNGIYDSTYTGLVKHGDKHLAVINGAVSKTYTGIIRNNNNGNWHYVKNGVYDKTFTGIAKRIDDNQDYLVVKGYLDPKRDGLIKVGSKYYAIDKGKVNYGFTGIVQNKTNKNWHYVKKGVYDNTFTGIAKRIDNNQDYLVVKGYLDPKRDGLIKVGSKYYAIDKGKVNYGFTGLVQNKVNGNWHYVKKGIYDKTYAGLAKSIEDGKLYYVKDGKLDKTYNGYLEYESNFYAVKDGTVATGFTGACQKASDKKWYYVKNGVHTKGFNGIAKSMTGNKKIYMKNSVIDTSYKAIYHTSSGDDYYVEKGLAYTRNEVISSSLDNKDKIANIMTSKATKYSYEIKPILAPLGKMILVKTENPDPTSFCLIDKSSKYSETIWVRSDKYADVVYENASANVLRVKGGYIFRRLEGTSDGGDINLMIKAPGSSNFEYLEEAKEGSLMTNITIKTSAFTDFADYLIEKYTTSDMSFFEKMYAVQEAVNSINIYPFPVRDRNKEGSTKYPYMQVPGHKDQYWMYKVYSSVGGSFDEGILAISAYPMVSDSLGTPSFMATLAKRIDPQCETQWDDYSHYLINVTYNGETRSFGGAGEGGSSILFSDRLIKDFKFDGSSNDFIKGISIEKMRERLMYYKTTANQDEEEYSGVLEGEEYRTKTKNGAWLRTSYGDDYRFIYALNGWEPYCIWVDGKYIDENHRIEWAAKFNDHPEADVLIHNISYVDREGVQHKKEDVIFHYDSDLQKWVGEEYYYGYYVDESDIPSEMIKTSSQIKQLNVDQYTKSIPDTTLCYDGSLYPGTPVKTVRVTGISIAKTINARVGQTIETSFEDWDFECVITPSNASLKETVWTSSNPDIADFEYYMGRYLRLECKKKGTVTVTVTTADGKHKATCKVIIE